MKKITLFLLLVFLYNNSNAQFNNNWYIGVNAGLNFSTATPSVLTNGKSPSNDYTSTMSDASGNLLFYTDGITVWDKNQNVMPNGTGLIGSFTGGACALIVPIPCSNKKYVIFHTTDFSNPGYLNYTVIDMNLNSGLGDVVSGQKNISLGSGWTEKLCAYYNPAINAYWVVSHKWMSDQFVSFKVDASTIATTSVVTSIGSIHNCGSVGGAHDAMGQLTISPDGTKLANGLTCQDKFEIFDFDINTGVLSNSILITPNTGNAWGTAFSPDSKKLYTSSIFGADIFQYDISTYNSSAINSSKTSVYTVGSTGYNFGYIELGPNGKLYIVRPNTNFLSVINTPNNLGTACSFSFSGQSLGAVTLKWGISRIAYNIGLSNGNFSLSASSASATCNGTSNGSATVIPTNPGTYNYTWMPGSYTTSVVTGLPAGNYTVTVSNVTCSTTSTVITIAQPQPISLSITQIPQPICNGGNAILSSTLSGGTPAYTYSWSTGSIFSGISVNPMVNTGYTLTITDANGCINSAVTTVSVTDCTNISAVNSNDLNFSIYPNPCNIEFSVNYSGEIDEIIIVNVLGEVVKKIKYTSDKINVKELSQGVYFVHIVRNSEKVKTEKIIKTD